MASLRLLVVLALCLGCRPMQDEVWIEHLEVSVDARAPDQGIHVREELVLEAPFGKDAFVTLEREAPLVPDRRLWQVGASEVALLDAAVFVDGEAWPHEVDVSWGQLQVEIHRVPVPGRGRTRVALELRLAPGEVDAPVGGRVLEWRDLEDGWNAPLRHAEVTFASRPPELSCIRSCTHYSYEMGGLGFRYLAGAGPGALKPPPTAEVSGGSVAWLLLPIGMIVGLGVTAMRRRRGRSRRTGVAIRYRPPPGFTPAELGALLGGDMDDGDLSATLLDLSRRGYLEIRELAPGTLPLQQGTKHGFRSLKPADGALKRHETLILEALFEDGDEVYTQRAREAIAAVRAQVRDAVQFQVSLLGRTRPTPRGVAGWGLGTPTVACFGGACIVAGFGWLSFACAFSLGLTTWLALTIVPRLPMRVPQHTSALEHAIGFRRFLERTEEDRLDRWRDLHGVALPAVLPFAVALGLSSRWEDAFAELHEPAAGERRTAQDD